MDGLVIDALYVRDNGCHDNIIIINLILQLMVPVLRLLLVAIVILVLLVTMVTLRTVYHARGVTVVTIMTSLFLAVVTM